MLYHDVYRYRDINLPILGEKILAISPSPNSTNSQKTIVILHTHTHTHSLNSSKERKTKHNQDVVFLLFYITVNSTSLNNFLCNTNNNY